MNNKILVKHVGRVIFGTTLSRIFGYIRDLLVASIFGAGSVADTFYLASRIPNLFRRMFGEGSFTSALVPVFSEYISTKNRIETQSFLNTVFTIFLFMLIVAYILGMFFATDLVKIIASGFSNNSEKIKLTIELTKLMFPFVIFIGLATFLLAVLNVLRSFFIPAIAPTVSNFSEIFYMLVVVPFIFLQNDQIKGLAISIVVGGVLHFFIQYLKLKNLGWCLRFNIDLRHPGIKKIALLMVPSIIGLSVDQINVVVDSRYASFLGSGSVTALYYANRLMQMPLAIFGLAFASVSLPAMSKAYAKKDMVALKSFFNYSIRFTVFTLFPSAIGLMVIGLPIVRLLFEYGKFNSLASLMTNNVLFYYSLGLPAYAFAKIFANAFYSFQDAKTPVKIAVLSMILHIILCILLVRPMGIGGLAFATAVSSYFNFLLLILCLKLRIGRLGLKKILFSTFKSFFASIVSGIVAWSICKVSLNLFISVPVAIISGVISFIVVSYILKSEELKILMHSLFRK
ncbi:MAG: murein biosynthesis integral membrane protein MurJ [Endomicrobium sp.]|jgi:putative peptidoglycan lipid II flippase|nr:murein biosynthesis integral membrane protein MurJ [Endomicrobium sp.]